MSRCPSMKDATGSVFDKHSSHDSRGPLAQVQNTATSRVYIFGEGNVAEEELLNEERESSYELRARGKSGKDGETEDRPNVLFIERPIQEGETLQKIAIKYCCEIAELKRFNNLIRDQDFHALKVIKVPVKKHSLVSEQLQKEVEQYNLPSVNGSAVQLEQDSGASNFPNGLEEDWQDIDQMSGNEESETTELLVRTLSIRDTLSSQSHEAKDFLSRMDKDIKSILLSTNSKKKNLDEVRTSLTCRRIYPLNRKEGLWGADCGIKLGSIVAVIVLVALVTPLFYFLYYEYMKPSDSIDAAHPGHR